MLRPFLTWSIIQLEAEFDRANSAKDDLALERIRHELTFRTVPRAAKLRDKVAHAIHDTNGADYKAIFSSEKSHAQSEQLTVEHPTLSTSPRAPKVELTGKTENLPPPLPPRVDAVRRAPFECRTAPKLPQLTQLDQKDARNLLSTWIALEVLSPPQTYRRPADLADREIARIASFGKSSNLPWERGEKARPKTRLFYQIVIGAIEMEDATAKLLEIYGDENIERVTAAGFAPIAILTVDNKGIPIEPLPVTISSFAWGFPHALRRDLSALANWPVVESRLAEEASELVRGESDEGQPLPVTRSTIASLFHHLLQKLALPKDCVMPPDFAIRVYHWWKADEPPDPPPMGSFFVSDLARAKSLVENGSAPQLIQKYFGVLLPPALIDIRRDDIALANAVAPNRTSAGCWPSQGGYPLVLLQQAAVNLALETGTASELLPVNGPPGTGKTTLLRDLVVASIVQRAQVMCEFNDPNDAFKSSGERFKSGNAFTHHYGVDPKLAGFEIVVASSNNRAVENISAELPSLAAIDSARVKLRYFKSIADNVARGLAQNARDDDEERNDKRARSKYPECWGLIAAVLGNAKNRAAFRQTAWSSSETGLRTYLLEASGNAQVIEVKDPATGRIVEKRKPQVVLAEKPPTSSDAALKQWQSARKKFLEALRRVEERLAILEKGRLALVPSGLLAKRHACHERLTIIGTKIAALRDGRKRVEEAAGHDRLLRAQIEQAIRAHANLKPSILSRIVGSSAQFEWDQERSRLVKSQDDLLLRKSKTDTALVEARKAEALLESERAQAELELQAASSALEAIAADIDGATALSGARFVDAAFFERDDDNLQRDTPWLDEQTLRLREMVFVAAMDLHHAFVDAAAKQIRNNLDLLFRAFFGRAAWTDKMRPLMPSLWTTFFCVVPIVSTTFASIERMFGYLGPQALGLLLIDEAGQATPQAAVGALVRARRAVVVGDPIQLPPVTTLPTELADKIADQFKVNKERFVAPDASVQSLTDASSVYGTTILSDAENVRVGVPLVVHRRCTEPMFSLSNNLAYGGMMVQGRGEKASSIRDILGPSAWIDVKPDRCEDKWSFAEGRAVIDLFRKLDRAELDEIDLYLISPFRIVAQKLRDLLVDEKILARWTDRPRDWVKERVGTVYTVQGREADTVIMVLGAAEPQRRGARNWAGQSVNQLNVAVTRAKENLYVIGNRYEWASAGKFESLERTFAPESLRA